MGSNLVWNYTRDLKSQVWLQAIIVRHEVKLALYYNHFEITTFSFSDTRFLSLLKSFNNPVVSCRFVESCKSCFNFILLQFNWFLQTSDWLLHFSKVSLLAGKKMRFKTKKWCGSWINQRHWEPIRSQGLPVISKWMQLSLVLIWLVKQVAPICAVSWRASKASQNTKKE